jgi:hypothetical protein
MRGRRCGLGQQEHGTDQEAQGTEGREGVGGGQVDDASGRGDDIGGDGRDPEGDASGEVDGGDLRLEAAARPACETAADLDVRQIAGDEEARRADGVGSPDQLVVRRLSSPVCIARKVSRLNNSVPANWSTLLHQSIRRGSKASRRSRRWCPPPGPRSALKFSRHWSVAAEVKKTEPTKNTIPSTPDPTSSTNPGNGAIRKQVDPRTNRTPIHHDARSGAHQTRSCPGAARESRDACLRCARDDHVVVPPSGRRKVRWVVNGPTARRSTGVHPFGASGYELMPGS